MEKLQQNLKQMVDHIHVPTNKLNKTVQTALKIAKQQDDYNRKKTQRVLSSIASLFVLAIGALLFASFFTNSVNSHLDHSVLYHNSHDEGLQRMVSEEQTTKLELEAEDQKIKVTLEEAYLDQYQLAVSYRVDSNETTFTDEELSVNMILHFDDNFETEYRMTTKTEKVENGGIVLYRDEHGFSDKMKISIKIFEINGIQGDWAFNFPLERQDELKILTSLPSKEETIGNSFSIEKAELTPSELHLTTNTTFAEDYKLTALKHKWISIVAIDSDGYMHTPKRTQSSTPREFLSHIPVTEQTKLARHINAYTYKIVPYLVSYNGKKFPSHSGDAYKWDEITAPFVEGSIINTPSKIRVIDIEHKKEETIVVYDMEQVLHFFPKIRDRQTQSTYEAMFFKKYEDYVTVHYPKVAKTETLEFFEYDGIYTTFPDLETIIHFK